MEPALSALAAGQGGIFTTRQANQLGVGRHRLSLLRASGEVAATRHGAYVLASALAVATPEEGLRLSTAAVLASRRSPAWACHHAGLAVHGLPLHDVDLRRIDIVADVAHVTDRSGVRTHPLPPAESLMIIHGVPACSVATCVVQTAAASGVSAAVVAADAALRRRLVREADLESAADRLVVRRGRSSITAALRLVDGRSESPGESLVRLLLGGAGLDFHPQARIRDDAGSVVARVDGLVDRWVVVEFDGAVKYEGASGRDALIAEKRREDTLRRLGYEIVRITWADLADPAGILRQVRRASARAAKRR